MQTIFEKAERLPYSHKAMLSRYGGTKQWLAAIALRAEVAPGLDTVYVAAQFSSAETHLREALEGWAWGFVFNRSRINRVTTVQSANACATYVGEAELIQNSRWSLAFQMFVIIASILQTRHISAPTKDTLSCFIVLSHYYPPLNERSTYGEFRQEYRSSAPEHFRRKYQPHQAHK